MREENFAAQEYAIEKNPQPKKPSVVTRAGRFTMDALLVQFFGIKGLILSWAFLVVGLDLLLPFYYFTWPSGLVLFAIWAFVFFQLKRRWQRSR